MLVTEGASDANLALLASVLALALVLDSQVLSECMRPFVKLQSF